jgi:hypothetical protein
MRYLYMNNFRGFTECVVPIGRTNFLVGENSTGKSSFLRLLSILSHHMFTWEPTFAFDQATEQGTFEDLVSAASSDRGFFEVGMLDTDPQKLGPRGFLYSFRAQEGMPKVASVLRWQNGIAAQVEYSTDGPVRIRTVHTSKDMLTDLAAHSFRVLKWLASSTEGEFTEPPSEYGFGYEGPPSHYLALAMPSEQRVAPYEDRLFQDKIVWIAPIRSAPKQFYGGARAAFSPDGEHSPYVLRRALQQGESTEFVEYLRNFGQASGLFDALITHTFGPDPRSPFELLVKFHNAELSINNVGYGVSQVLPLIVELLTNPPETIFLIQQPEVHLHPRAQAALGALMFQLAESNRYSYFVETHSDFLIDRYRLTLRHSVPSSSASDQVLFFTRTQSGNSVYSIQIDEKGRFESEQPPAFRDFFIREEMSLLEL